MKQSYTLSKSAEKALQKTLRGIPECYQDIITDNPLDYVLEGKSLAEGEYFTLMVRHSTIMIVLKDIREKLKEFYDQQPTNFITIQNILKQIEVLMEEEDKYGYVEDEGPDRGSEE